MTFPSCFLLPIACVPARPGPRMERRDTACRDIEYISANRSGVLMLTDQSQERTDSLLF